MEINLNALSKISKFVERLYGRRILRTIPQFGRLPIFLALGLVSLNASGVTFRWASTSNRIYVDGPGSATLSDIKAALPTAPLTLVAGPGPVWLVTANIIVQSNAQLRLYGPASGGDVAELRLKSDNTSDSNAVVELRADCGWLDIRNTKITSWDSAVGGPDTETETYGRAFVRVRSSLDADGVTVYESRMDVINSEICYLGSLNSEAYGLVWKVVDTTATNLPPDATNTLFDVVKVYGDVLNSHLHHNFFGIYTYGLAGGHWANNEVAYNLGYGCDPHDDSDGLIIENNRIHDNGWHGLIASKRCDNGILRSNVVWNNGKNGIMFHRSCDQWLVTDNQSFNNGDSGIAIFASSGLVIRDNLCLSNGNAGIRLSVGAANNVVSNNVFGHCGQYGIYLYNGSNLPNPGDDGHPKQNLFVGNLVYEYGSDALKLRNADANQFIGNTFLSAGDTVLRFEDCLTSVVSSNSFPTNVLAKIFGVASGTNQVDFTAVPQMALVLDTFSTATFTDAGGAVFEVSPSSSIPTTVSAAGSVAVVTLAGIGGPATTVLTRKLFISPATGSLLVTPNNLSSSGNPSWTILTTNGTTSATYTVGNLGPGNSYEVSASSPPAVLGPFTASPLGEISFTALNNATPDTFTVTAIASAVPVGPVALTLAATATNTLLLTWPTAAVGWQLQQNDWLGTTNWIAATNAVIEVGAQYQVVIPTAAGSRFFRLAHP